MTSLSRADQQRFLDLIGTPPEHKRTRCSTAATSRATCAVSIREVLNWFDTYLGPVK